MFFVSLFMGLAIIGMGFLIEKDPDLIAGYNTMSAEKKKNVDIQKIASIYKTGMIIIGITTTLLTYLLIKLDLYEFTVLSLILPLLLGTLILFLITSSYNYNKQSKFEKIFPIFLIVAAIFLVFILFNKGRKPTEVIYNGNEITFTGTYGLTINRDSIKKVELLNTIPKIKMRINAIGLGRIQKGHYKLEKLGSCRLLIDYYNPPFLFIQLNNGSKIIYNSKETQCTKNTYEKIK